MDGNSIDNANTDENDSARIPPETLINNIGVSGIKVLEDFHRRKSENGRNINTLGKKRGLRTPALSKRDPLRVVVNKADVVKTHPGIVENQENGSFVQCVGGSKSFYCKNLHEDTLIKQAPKLKDAFSARAFNNILHNKFQNPLEPDRKFSKGLPGQPQSQNFAVESKFYKQDDGLLGYSTKTYNTDCELCKLFDINKNVQQNNAFLKRSRQKRIALYNTKPTARSIFYKQRSEASREHNNKRSADDISFYKRASDDHNNFYKKRVGEKRAFHKRMQYGNAAFYKRSSNGNSALYKRSLADNRAFYKRTPDDNSAFYKRSPDDNSMFYKRPHDDNSMFYKRSPGDNSALFSESLNARSAFYKRALKDKTAFYKRAFDNKNAFYKRGRNEQGKFYKRRRNEQSKFYKRKHENNALYKREIIEEAALYKQKADSDNVIPRPVHYGGTFDNHQHEDKSPFYKRA